MPGAFGEPGGQVGQRIANINLAASDVVRPAIQRQAFGQAQHRVFARGIAVKGRGVCAEIEPLLMIRPPCGFCFLIRPKAPRAHRKTPVTLVLMTL